MRIRTRPGRYRWSRRRPSPRCASRAVPAPAARRAERARPRRKKAGQSRSGSSSPEGQVPVPARRCPTARRRHRHVGRVPQAARRRSSTASPSPRRRRRSTSCTTPARTTPGKPWSNWGDSLAVNGKYYASIGDHLAVGAKGDGTHGTGNGFVYEYDPEKKTFRQLVDVAKVLNLPDGPLHAGQDPRPARPGRATAGSTSPRTAARTRPTTDKYHYKGDWILRCDPKTGKTEVVAQGPVPKHCIPNSVLDPERLIFYGGTAAGTDGGRRGDRQFFAYDVKNKKLLYSGPNGPARYMIFAKSTGERLLRPRQGGQVGPLMRYDPAKGGAAGEDRGAPSASAPPPRRRRRASSTPCPRAGRQADADAVRLQHEDREGRRSSARRRSARRRTSPRSTPTRPAATSTTSPAPTAAASATAPPVVQFDTKTEQKKVIAFLHPFYKEKYGATLVGHLQLRPSIPTGRQALRHLERQPRQQGLGLLGADRDPHPGIGTEEP